MNVKTISERLTAENWAPYVVTGVVIAVLWCWYMIGLGQDGLSKIDEFFTYDRSLGFARNNDWFTVFSQNEPSLKKPPLQYWMTAGMIEMGWPHMTALHLPSMLFALGTLIVTAWLARVMIPDHPWLMLPAVLLVASSKNFWGHATSAMLDNGAMFFSTLGIATMFAAFERPRLWPWFAVTVFLAGMQKSPTPLAFLALALLSLILTQRWQDRPTSEIWKNRVFLWTMAVCLLLAFLWPLFQYLRFGFGAEFQGSVRTEMLDRFAPSVSDRSLQKLSEIILGNAPGLRLVGLIGLFFLPFKFGRPRLLAATGIAVFFFLGMWMASGKVYDRYTLLILPMLMVGAAGGIMLISKRLWVRVLLLAVLCLSEEGPLKRSAAYNHPSTAEQFGIDLQDLLEPLQTMVQPDETLVVCGFDNRRRLPLGAASVYASPDQRFVYMRRPDLRGYLGSFGYTSGPLRGVCRAKELDRFADELVGLVRQPVEGTKFVYWSADGLAGE
ncbi:hypothetical protein RKLH11_3506 [Rhodobacteraceae bacterium KLH11]|nr:hypothetical protein RKLH11_3506 [Rhodobacteraceae bacterium KLH11]